MLVGNLGVNHHAKVSHGGYDAQLSMFLFRWVVVLFLYCEIPTSLVNNRFVIVKSSYWYISRWQCSAPYLIAAHTVSLCAKKSVMCHIIILVGDVYQIQQGSSFGSIVDKGGLLFLDVIDTPVVSRRSHRIIFSVR